MEIVIGLLALALGSSGGYFARKVIAKNQAGTAEAKAVRILEDAKIEAKKHLVDAKNKAVEDLEEVKKEEKKQREVLRNVEHRLDVKEQKIDSRISQVEKEKRTLENKANEIRKVREEVLRVKEQQVERLERIAEMKKEDAKKVLLSLAEKDNKDEIVRKISTLEREKKEEIEGEAKDLMAIAMQRYAGSHATDTTTTTISIPSDEMKGRIIGREGRNIKALERLTGAEIIVDDTPEAIVISGFDPIRRETAKIALGKLIEDGRIHPAKIEESVEKAREELNRRIKEAGEAAVYDVGIPGLENKLSQLLGRLKYRTSYGQNVLLHSLEVAHISGVLAAELGLDSAIAKKAGLLHDIGKSVDHEVQGTHVEIGANILEKFKQSKQIIDAVKSHHEDYPFRDNYGLIIAAADALSASRPGARKDTLENYLKRLRELEEVVLSFGEVDKCYAIQAGREVRVFVNPEKIGDLDSLKLAKKIAQKIEEDLNYPGEIKINVLRETRSVEYAR
ncbi:ribonuclease Y [bacterium]|jgi:ribonucrease Y|nr:ribonuclease Y [bacterium]MBT4251448.1 ribonuclease Y [bacterium]MBT4597422.1 ribonuclease Y [bacterium]MBT6754261.1 ribonuclease Y [bacterium]MBT7037587.1 ribonuclease Y [bacterium]